MREPGHSRDYIRAGWSDEIDRVLGVVQDLGEWQLGTFAMFMKFVRRAHILSKGRTPPRTFDYKVKLDQMDVFMEAAEQLRYRRIPPAGMKNLHLREAFVILDREIYEQMVRDLTDGT